MNRRGFFTWVGTVIAGVFAAWHRVGRGRITDPDTLPGGVIETSRLNIITTEGHVTTCSDGGFLVYPEHAEQLFDMVEHPTLESSTGGPVLVPRYLGKGPVFHE